MGLASVWIGVDVTTKAIRVFIFPTIQKVTPRDEAGRKARVEQKDDDSKRKQEKSSCLHCIRWYGKKNMLVEYCRCIVCQDVRVHGEEYACTVESVLARQDRAIIQASRGSYVSKAEFLV